MKLIRCVLVSVALLWAPVAMATIERWDVPLSGDQVRNASTPDGTSGSAGSGWVHFVYDSSTQLLHYAIRWQALEGDLTKLHVHGPADPEANNPNHLIELLNAPQDLIDLELDPRDDELTGVLELDDATASCSEAAGTPSAPAATTLACLRAERAYVNVHTTVHPMGELRASLVSAPLVVSWSFLINEAHVANGDEPDGSTNSPGWGEATVRYEQAPETLFYRISWNALEGDMTKLHVHGPAAPGENEPGHLFEIFNNPGEIIDDAGLDPRSDEVTSEVALSSAGVACEEEAGSNVLAGAATLPCMIEGRAYVNVHTTVDPMGEIRGDFPPRFFAAPEPRSTILGGAVLLVIAFLRSTASRSREVQPARAREGSGNRESRM